MDIQQDQQLWEEKNSIEPPVKLESKTALEAAASMNLINREFAMNEWKNTGLPKISGIYKIINKINGKYYVGSSNNIFKRWAYHIQDLSKCRHNNKYLQRSWNKYSSSNFKFIILIDNIIESDLLIIEQKYIDIADSNKCYNNSKIAGKVEFTNEIRKIISDKLKGNTNALGCIHSPETCQRISNSLKGKKCPARGRKGIPLTEEHKAKLKESRKRQIFSEETKQKHRDRMNGPAHPTRGKKLTDEHKQKIREGRLGKRHTEEWKQMMSKKYSGKNNVNYDHSMYSFINIYTNEEFAGIRDDFAIKTNTRKANVNKLVSGSRKCLRTGWMLKS